MAGLGEILEQARLEGGATLDDAERATHISRRYLRALETEDFSVFAAPVFMRGFLRTYSQYLGLDPGEMLSLLPAMTESGFAEPPSPARGEAPARLQRNREPPSRGQSAQDRSARLVPGRERPAPVRAVPRRGLFPSGQAPSPLTRVHVPAAKATSRSAVLVVIGGALLAVILLGLVASRIGGRRSLGLATRSTASPAAAAGTSPGQPRATPPPPARKAGSMPNLVGKDGQAAISQLQQVGVTPLVISVQSGNRSDRPGVVLKQDPAAGTAITTNSNVTLIVNQAPTVATPAVATPIPFGTPRLTAPPNRLATPVR